MRKKIKIWSLTKNGEAVVTCGSKAAAEELVVWYREEFPAATWGVK